MRTLKTSGQFASFVHCRMLLFPGIFGLACIYLKVDNIVRGSYPYGKLNSFLLDIFIHFAPKLWCSERLIISSRPTFIEPIKFTQTWRINQEHLCYLRIGFYSCQTCDTWDGLSCHLVNAEKQNVDSRQIFIWSLIHGLNWFGLIKQGWPYIMVAVRCLTAKSREVSKQPRDWGDDRIVLKFDRHHSAAEVPVKCQSDCIYSNLVASRLH